MSNRFYILLLAAITSGIGLAMVLSVGRAQELQLPTPPQPTLADPPASADQDKVEALEQGPIHEAFAEPLALEGQAPLIVPRKPPEPVQELPPETVPEGRNVQWIPGYFQWMEDRQDFVWVSGFYRDIPPGRQWTPGEWVEVDGGWQWAPGYWSDGKAAEVQYLPEPPATLEQGPSSPAPGNNYQWAPGCWQWDGGAYAWQPGYWYEARQDWVWVPSHYCRTPRGFVYVSGFWDYPFAFRGLLYAPFYWRGGWGTHIGWGYRPYFALNTSFLSFNLFIDSGYRNYWYGYHGKGRPDWVRDWGHNRHGHYGEHGKKKYYDPDWAHNDWNRRNGRGDWNRDGERGDWNRDGRGGEFARDGRGRDGRGVGRSQVITTADALAKETGTMKLRHLDGAELKAQEDRAEQFRRYSQRRESTQGTDNSQSGVTGEIRRRSDFNRSMSRMRVEGDASTQLGGQGQSGQTENRVRSFSRGEGRARVETGGSTSGGAQGQGRVQVQSQGSTDNNQSTADTNRRAEFRSRVESSEGSSRQSYRGSPQFSRRQTVTPQSGGGPTQVQSDSSNSGGYRPRTEYRMMRPQTSLDSGGSAQSWSGQARRSVPQGDSGSSIRSYQGSSQSWSGGSGQSSPRSSRSFSSGGMESRSFSGGGGSSFRSGGSSERRSFSGGGGGDWGGGGGGGSAWGGGGGGGDGGGGGGGRGGRSRR